MQYMDLDDVAELGKMTKVEIKKLISEGKIAARLVGSGRKQYYQIPYTEVEKIIVDKLYQAISLIQSYLP